MYIADSVGQGIGEDFFTITQHTTRSEGLDRREHSSFRVQGYRCLHYQRLYTRVCINTIDVLQRAGRRHDNFTSQKSEPIHVIMSRFPLGMKTIYNGY